MNDFFLDDPNGDCLTLRLGSDAYGDIADMMLPLLLLLLLFDDDDDDFENKIDRRGRSDTSGDFSNCASGGCLFRISGFGDDSPSVMLRFDRELDFLVDVVENNEVEDCWCSAIMSSSGEFCRLKLTLRC